jgi:hypothetical protein
MISAHAQRSGRDLTFAALADGRRRATAGHRPKNEDTP